MTPRIVVTGGPGSGKTKFIDRLRTEPHLSEFIFFDELARELLTLDPSLRSDRHRLHTEIYRRQIEREEAVHGQPFISDRGTVDAFAFHPEMLKHLGTSLKEQYKRYTAVIHLESAAILGDPYYRTDSVRIEPVEDALAIQDAIRKAWRGHPNYHYVPADIDIERKYHLFLSEVLLLSGEMEKQD